ncbi:hypothetical protein AB6F63_16520 [Providencia hangzhouensis]
MTKKSKTKEDKQWLSDVATLGCICCRNMGYGVNGSLILTPLRLQLAIYN